MTLQELLEQCVGEIDLMLAAASTVINDGRDLGSDVVVGMEYVLMGINTRLIHLADEVESRTTCSNPEWPRSPSVRITGETTPHDTPDRPRVASFAFVWQEPRRDVLCWFRRHCTTDGRLEATDPHNSGCA